MKEREGSSKGGSERLHILPFILFVCWFIRFSISGLIRGGPPGVLAFPYMNCCGSSYKQRLRDKVELYIHDGFLGLRHVRNHAVRDDEQDEVLRAVGHR